MKKRLIVYLCIFLYFFVVFTPLSFSSGIDVFSKGEKHDVTIENLPLNQAVKELSQLIPFEIKGSISADENINVSFKNISLDELLKRILKGYNYVLIKTQDKKPVLMVMGRAERTKYVDTPNPAVQNEPRIGPQPLPERSITPPPAPTTQPAATGGRPVITGMRGENKEATENQINQEQLNVPVFGGSRPFAGQGSLSGSASTQARAVERSLIPPSPPAISGLDVPPSPPSIEAPPSIPVDTGSTTTGASSSVSSGITTGSSSATGESGSTQSKPAPRIEDLRPPQIPMF